VAVVAAVVVAAEAGRGKDSQRADTTHAEGEDRHIGHEEGGKLVVPAAAENYHHSGHSYSGRPHPRSGPQQDRSDCRTESQGQAAVLVQGEEGQECRRPGNNLQGGGGTAPAVEALERANHWVHWGSIHHSDYFEQLKHVLINKHAGKEEQDAHLPTHVPPVPPGVCVCCTDLS
jgi:hypothetical protein